MRNDNPSFSAGNGNLKYLAGNALIARGVLEQKVRPFLFRNLEAALNDHEARVRANRPQINGFHPSGVASESIPKVRLDRSTWEIPKRRTLNHVFDMTTTRLKVNITGLRPVGASGNSVDSHEPANSTRKRHKVVHARCRIELAIYELKVNKSTGKPEKRSGEEPLIKTVFGDANLQGSRHDDGKFHFDIDMVDPLIVSLDQLEVPVMHGKYTKMERASHYEIMMKFWVRGGDGKQVLECIEGARVPAIGDMDPLIARWRSLPRCPTSAIRAMQVIKGQKKQTNYAFLVDIAWGHDHGFKITKVTDTHLAQFNTIQRTRAAASLPTPLSTPTPSLAQSQTHETPKVPVQLEYVIPGNEVTISGLRCVFCCRMRELPSVARLRLHFETSHSNHHEVFKVIEHSASRVEVVVESEARGRGTRKKKPIIPNLWSPEHEELWIAPAEPFDIEKIADGDFSWEDSGSIARKLQNQNENNAVPTIKPKAPEDVMRALPVRRKKKFRVPEYPTNNTEGPRRYFSSGAQRVLEPGEELSESDDDIPMDWLLLKALNSIDADTTWTLKEKSFYKSIMTHFQRERTAADLFLGDSIIRWVHSSEAQSLLVDKDIQDAFEEWLEVKRNRISKEVFQHCIGKARATSANAKEDAHASYRRSPCRNRGKRRSTIPDSDIMEIDEEDQEMKAGVETSSLDTTVGANSNARARNGCSCGAPLGPLIHRVLCANLVCYPCQPIFNMTPANSEYRIASFPIFIKSVLG
jgi:hypothetical protein